MPEQHTTQNTGPAKPRQVSPPEAVVCRGNQKPAWLAGWLERHQHPASFWLHMVGIPMAVACIPLAIVQLTREQWDLWWRPVVLFVGGYLLQWIGHRIEGNDVGEIILVKKLLGRPYVAVSPRYKASEHKSEVGVGESAR